MTNREAIANIKRAREFLNGSYVESINTVLKMVDKQVPKQVFVDEAGKDLCPNCKKEIGANNFGTSYCKFCGQCLSWNEVK